jgi:hypothetical protein
MPKTETIAVPQTKAAKAKTTQAPQTKTTKGPKKRKEPVPVVEKSKGTMSEAAEKRLTDRCAVWVGAREKTGSGLTKDDLMLSPNTGRIVSKKAGAASARRYHEGETKDDLDNNRTSPNAARQK